MNTPSNSLRICRTSSGNVAGTAGREARRGALLVLLLVAATASIADPVTWGTTSVTVDTAATAWMRMVHLQDGSWLAAYTIFPSGANTEIKLQRSTDDMRTWTYL